MTRLSCYHVVNVGSIIRRSQSCLTSCLNSLSELHLACHSRRNLCMDDLQSRRVSEKILLSTKVERRGVGTS